MSLFVLIPLTHEALELIDETVEDAFAEDAYKLSLGQWLIDYRGTAKQLHRKLELGQDHPAMIVKAANWWGYAPADVWDWVDSRYD